MTTGTRGPRGAGVAQLVERRTRDPETQGSNPVRSTRKMCESFFPSQNVMLTRCRCAQPPCAQRTYGNDHCSPCQSSVDYGNTKTTQHARVGLGSAALRVAVAGSEVSAFPRQRENKLYTIKLN